MEFVSPTGRTYKWNKDTPPSQADVDEMMAYDASLPPDKPKEPGMLSRLADSYVEFRKPQEQQDREALGRTREILMGESQPVEAQPGDINTVPQALAKGMAIGAKELGPTAIRIGGPMAAVMALPTGVGTGPAAAYLAASGLLSENVARAIEGQAPTDFKEGVQAAATSALLTPARVAPGLVNAAVGGTLEGLGFAGTQAVQEGRNPWEISAKDAAIMLPIGIGGRALESTMLARQAVRSDAALQKTYQGIASDAKAPGEKIRSELIGKTVYDHDFFPGNDKGKIIDIKDGVVVFDDGVNVGSVPIDQLGQRYKLFPGLTPEEIAAYEANKGTTNAARESAARSVRNQTVQSGIDEKVLPAGNTPVDDYTRRVNDFKKARTELQAAELADALPANQIGHDESVVLAPGATTQTRLDVELGPGQGALLERARMDARAAASPEGVARARVDAEFNKRGPRMSGQAQRMADEYGRIDPRILAPIARAGIGFAAGVAQGNTPEEDLGWGLTYALTGAVLSPSVAIKAGKAVLTGTELGRRWVPEATLAPFMEAIRAQSRDAHALLVAPKAAYNALTKELNAFKDPVARANANTAVYEYLTGGRHITTLPPALADAAQMARTAIDDLTDELISRGVAVGQLRDTLVRNTGAYLRRSYKLFTQPNWQPEPAVFNKWVDAHVQEALDAQKAHPPGKTPIRITTADEMVTPIQRYFNKVDSPLPGGGVETTWKPKSAAELKTYYTNVASGMLQKKDIAEEFINTGSATIDRSIFKPRKNLDGLTRELLGEIYDPLILFSDTAPRMAQNAATYQAHKNIVDIGEKLGLFARNSDGLNGRNVLLAESGTKFNPFAGVYATKEFSEAFNSISSKETNRILQMFASASALAKMPKTLGSTKAYSSNVWGGVMDVVAQGHGVQLLLPQNWKRAVAMTGTTFKIASPEGVINRGKTLDLYREMVREGLINKSVSGEDFVRTMELANPTSKAGKLLSRGAGFASRVYMTPESMGKVFSLAGEMKTLRAAFPGMADGDLFKAAAARVRHTSNDYEYLPRVVRKMSQFGALDPFISYTADRFRVVYNTYRIGMEDLASGNPVLRQAGAKRMAWMTAVLGAAGYFGANSHLSKEEDAALRRRLPPRDANGFLAISERKPDGSFTYTNLNYNIPQSIVMEAAMAATRGDSPQDSAAKFLSVVGEQAFGSNLLARPAIDVFRNQKETGKQVYSENVSAGQQAIDAAGYLAKEWFMPLAANEARKAYMATKEIADASGQKYDPADLIKANFGGVRIYRIDLPTRFQADAARLSESLGRDLRDYSSAKRRAITEDGKESNYQTFEAKRRNVWEKTSQMVSDARTMGYSDDEIVKMLKGGGIPARILAGAFDGLYLPTEKTPVSSPSDQFEEWAADGVTGVQQIREKIADIAKTDRPRAQSLFNHLRDTVMDERRGITATDKLLLSYAQDDKSRARYISMKLDELARTDPGAMKGYHDDLVRKRIITPVVERQLREIRMPSANR